MIKKYWGLIALLSTFTAHATDLLTVYNQALSSDPVYLSQVAQTMASVSKDPAARASLLPQINLQASVGHAHSNTKTAASVDANTNETNVAQSANTRGYTLSLTQPIFNFTSFASWRSAKANAKAAQAALVAAQQNLIVRVANAYFAVLQAEDLLSYDQGQKKAFKEQMEQAQQQFDAGLKTITDVYNARAAYDGAVAQVIADQNAVDNAYENLKAITGERYTSLTPLSAKFPLSKPAPENIESWGHNAVSTNWNVQSAYYTTLAAQQTLRASVGGHLPTLDFIASDSYTRNQYTGNDGASRVRNDSLGLQLNLPIFSGGGVSAQVEASQANYEYAQQQLELTRRTVLNNTRQAYLGVLASISKLKADEQNVLSNRSAVESMKAGYEIGTQTMVDVLNTQKNLYTALSNYAADRYTYVNTSLQLKNAAGTLNLEDLRTLNVWLENNKSQIRLVAKNKPAIVESSKGKLMLPEIEWSI